MNAKRTAWTILAFAAAIQVSVPGIGATQSSPVEVKVVRDEADAVMKILEVRAAKQTPDDAHWKGLFECEGYRRLCEREASMGRAIRDDEFKSFVMEIDLDDRRPALEQTLAAWAKTDPSGAAKKALAYLPQGARIRAKIYPMIKPLENTFVFDLGNDPAIFFYLDPTMTAAQFENTLAHELHHIGFANLPSIKDKTLDLLTPEAKTVVEWIGSFGEGFAMLAAAGGPDVHPHADSKPEDRERWDNDMKNFDRDLEIVQDFFLDVLDKRLSAAEIQSRGFSFFGIQGPWYTVGWRMAVTIEKAFGRATLIDCIRHPRKLLRTYNEAAELQEKTSGETSALWSATLIDAIAE